MSDVTCIIAAYNEEKRIGAVLDVASACSAISEIIVVDDGSLDKTGEIVARRRGVRRISLPRNMGKSYAVAEGIAKARHETLLLIDADLLGLCEQNIIDLLEPVLRGNADVSLSLQENSLRIYRLLNLDFITGDRVIPRSLLVGSLDDIKKLPNYGLEVFMNRFIIQHKQRIAIVPFDHVVSPRKRAKIGFWKGVYGDVVMIIEILRVIGVGAVLYQCYMMRKLTIRQERLLTLKDA